MAQTNFNVGAIANDGTGEPLRQAFQEQQAMNTELYATKVDKVTGKQLSSNDYTDAEVIKLDGIEVGAEVNVQADWNQSDDTQDDYIKNKPTELFSSVGYFHYADLTTQTTPLSILSGVNKILNNDGEGAQTNTDQAPYEVSSVYNVLDNKFDFSKLSIGDTLNLRVDLSLTTTSANQKYLVFLRVGEGSDAVYDLPITNGHIKSVSSDNRIVGNEPFSIDYQQHIDNPAVLFIVSDDNATVKVNGFFINVVRKSVNIVDIVGGGAVDSVNGQTGVVVLDADDVGAIPITGTTVGNPITGNVEIRSKNNEEKALILSKEGTVGITENPKFSFGRIVNGGINEPKLRIVFSDDVAYTDEVTCFEVEPSGTAASVRSVIGSHYEGFLEGEEKPLFRIASFLKDGNKSTRMEFGSGGNNETDIFLERWASWAFALVMGGSPKIIFYPDSILRQPGVVDAFQQTPIGQVVATPNPDVKKLFYREGKGLVELGGDGIEKPLVNNNSYSTAETLTGGTWIDGKPIYRKVFTVADTSADINNTHSLPIETLIYNNFSYKIETTFRNESLTTSELGYAGINETHYFLYNQNMYPLTNISLTIEYTKTTD